ncbi:uncharacterized protein LOC113454799, partial [Pseudonaja textilis]|uniref:uncharacterized protein LOC113454799 n=1 Tax=Pseudonaja textilis TaxID=8673 RepID=UPI000EAA0BB2
MRGQLFGFLLIVCVLIISQRGKGVDLGEWKRNTLIQDMGKLANLHNKTDCWVCMHMPTHKTSGLPMVAVPLAKGDWYKGQCYGCSGTWSSSWTTSNINTLHLGSRIQEVAVNSVLTHDYWTQISRGVIPPLGVMMNYRDLHRLNNWTVTMFKDTIKTLKLLEEEQGKILDFVLQTRYAVDTILAVQGGVCTVVHTHCCMYISDYSPNITATIQHMEQTLKENPLQSEGEGLDVWSALWSWMPD